MKCFQKFSVPVHIQQLWALLSNNIMHFPEYECKRRQYDLINALIGFLWTECHLNVLCESIFPIYLLLKMIYETDRHVSTV